MPAQPPRAVQAFQSVKEAQTVKTKLKNGRKHSLNFHIVNNDDSQLLRPKKLALQDVLTYCANRRTNVPMYADAFGLLVFGVSLTSDR